MTDPVARKYAELQSRVGEHLYPGEALAAAIWVTPAASRPSAGEVARRELGPRQLLESIAGEAVGIDQASTGPGSYGDGRVLQPGSLAAQLDAFVNQPTIARALALTDARLVAFEKTAVIRPRRSLLQKAADFAKNRPNDEPLGPLAPRWECPRRALIAASVHGGRIHLSFGDGSALPLVTPEALAHHFAAAV